MKRIKIFNSEPCPLTGNATKPLEEIMWQARDQGWTVVSHTWVTVAQFYDGFWSVYTEKESVGQHIQSPEINVIGESK